jgi:hypothetical protein
MKFFIQIGKYDTGFIFATTSFSVCRSETHPQKMTMISTIECTLCASTDFFVFDLYRKTSTFYWPSVSRLHNGHSIEGATEPESQNTASAQGSRSKQKQSEQEKLQRVHEENIKFVPTSFVTKQLLWLSPPSPTDMQLSQCDVRKKRLRFGGCRISIDVRNYRVCGSKDHRYRVA